MGCVLNAKKRKSILNRKQEKAMFSSMRFRESKIQKPNKNYFIKTHIEPKEFLKLTKGHTAKFKKKSLLNIYNRIKRNLPIDTPILVVDVNNNKILNHDGRHRALVSKNNNIKKIPVYLAPIDTSENVNILMARNELSGKQKSILKNKKFKTQTDNFEYVS